MKKSSAINKKSTPAETAFQRSKVYRLMSYCFSYPTAELVNFLNEETFAGEIAKAFDVYPLEMDTSKLAFLQPVSLLAS